MDLSNITIGEVWVWLLAAAAAIASLSKVIDIVAARINPLRQRERSVDEKLRRDNDRLNALEKASEEQQKTNAVLFRAILAQINHELDGNHIDGLRKSRDEINEYLTNR